MGGGRDCQEEGERITPVAGWFRLHSVAREKRAPGLRQQGGHDGGPSERRASLATRQSKLSRKTHGQSRRQSGGGGKRHACVSVVQPRTLADTSGFSRQPASRLDISLAQVDGLKSGVAALALPAPVGSNGGKKRRNCNNGL